MPPGTRRGEGDGVRIGLALELGPHGHAHDELHWNHVELPGSLLADTLVSVGPFGHLVGNDLMGCCLDILGQPGYRLGGPGLAAGVADDLLFSRRLFGLLLVELGQS